MKTRSGTRRRTNIYRLWRIKWWRRRNSLGSSWSRWRRFAGVSLFLRSGFFGQQIIIILLQIPSLEQLLSSHRNRNSRLGQQRNRRRVAEAEARLSRLLTRFRKDPCSTRGKTCTAITFMGRRASRRSFPRTWGPGLYVGVFFSLRGGKAGLCSRHRVGLFVCPASKAT